MFPMRSNYMLWKRLRAHFCLDNGLELAWSEATLFWDGLIRGHFGLGQSDQRQFQAHTSLIRGRFERTLVWPETNSSDIFFKFFLFSYWLLLSRVRDNNKTGFWSELHLKIWWVGSEPRDPADNHCRSPQKKILIQSRSRRFYAELSKFIFSVKSIKNGTLSNFFDHFFFRFTSINNTFRIGFLLVEYEIDKMIDEMNIL